MAQPISHGRVLRVAAPITLANLSTPLVGMVDLGVVGRGGGAAEIGAVAAGSLITSLLFWGFGFLKMTTSGLSAQAEGRQDRAELAEHLYRGLLVASACGLALVLAQVPLLHLAVDGLQASPRVTELARTYLDIRIWAAPATLSNYVVLGWLIGRARTRQALALQLLLNLSNIALSVWLTLGLGWGVSGVAWGSAAAEHLTLPVSVLWLLPGLPRPRLSVLLRREPLVETLAHNRDVMIRTLTLLAVFAWFTLQGARQGDEILAANSLLMQLVNFSAFVLDGLAAATESLAGQAIGAGEGHRVAALLRITLGQGAGLALGLALCFAVIGSRWLSWLTDDPLTVSTSLRYLPWAVAAPLLGVVPFLLDGLYIGSLRTRALRDAMIGATCVFALAWWALRGYGNHGLWAAVSAHYLARALLLGARTPALTRELAASQPR